MANCEGYSRGTVKRSRAGGGPTEERVYTAARTEVVEYWCVLSSKTGQGIADRKRRKEKKKREKKKKKRRSEERHLVRYLVRMRAG